MLDKPFNLKMKRDFAEGLVQIIDKIVQMERMQTPLLPTNGPYSDDDKMLIAVLVEISNKLQVKLLKYQTEYTMKFSPAYMFALKILKNDWVHDNSSYMGIHLLKIAIHVDQQYQ